MELSDLITKVEEIANNMYDGHYTILKFTTHYKGMFGTPFDMYKELAELKPFNTLEELLNYMVHEG